MFEFCFTTKILIDKKDVARAMNIMLKYELTYLKNTFMIDGSLEIVLRTKQISKFKKYFDENKIRFSILSSFGRKFNDLKGRIGLVFGLLFLVGACFFSSKIIWEINIQGNEVVSNEKILESLNMAGISLGTYIPAIDYKSVHNKILLESNEISWVSVNIKGNVANVQVKETLSSRDIYENSYANIVASNDGQIALVNVIEGVKKISIGDVVKKGDLLISGVINSNSEGVRYVKAQGEVNAYVNRKITIKIPFKQSKKSYTNKVCAEYNIKIFNKNLFFLGKDSKSIDFYDTIEKNEQIIFFDRVKLPIYKTVIKKLEFEYVDTYYTKEQAIDLAFIKLRNEMDNLLKTTELISKDIVTSYDEEYFYIDCNLYCLENIAQSVNFYVEKNGG